MNESARRGLRRGLILAAALLVLGGGAAWWFMPRAQQAGDAVAEYGAAIGGPFELTGTDGRPFGSAQLRGKPFAIFFGFTRCPDVCPTTLSRMARLRALLGEEGRDLNMVFVSVDPRSDTPEGIGRYLTLFETPFIGLTGTPEQLATVKRAYGVFSEEVPIEGGGYTVDHTATIFLMDAEGRFVGTMDAHEADEPALAKLRRTLRGGRPA